MSHQWTPEQLAIFAAARDTKSNLLIEALAGAAKTSTLVELARHLKGTTLCLAFNKKVADEMAERMPKTVVCKTLNSLGHGVWAQRIGKKLQLSQSKLHNLLLEEIEQCLPEERTVLFDNLADIGRALQMSKNHGHVPDDIAGDLASKVTTLLSDEEFFELLPEEPTGLQIDVMLRVLTRSFNDALAGRIDYADQLLMPTVMRCSFPIFDNVLGDEVQDWSELNHVMVAKAAKRRIICVGDSLQAIYAFRGAHTAGMPLLQQRFNMTTLHLSTTFRCPDAVCEWVRHHAPRIQSWSGNPHNPGSVTFLHQWRMEDIPDRAAVLCRNNAPLFRFALRMLKEGRRPNLWGRDVAAALIKVMEGLGPINMRQPDAISALASYKREKEAKMKRASAKQNLAERVECLLVFLENAESLGGAISLAKNVFNSEGKVDLATGHKAKGAEWKEVFILDRDLIGDEGQEFNLAYVLATRAKSRLTYINTDDYIDPLA